MDYNSSFNAYEDDDDSEEGYESTLYNANAYNNVENYSDLYNMNYNNAKYNYSSNNDINFNKNYDFNNNNKESTLLQRRAFNEPIVKPQVKATKPVVRKFLGTEDVHKNNFPETSSWKMHPMMMDPNYMHQRYNNNNSLVANFSPMCSLKSNSSSPMHDLKEDMSNLDFYKNQNMINKFKHSYSPSFSEPHLRTDNSNQQELEQLQMQYYQNKAFRTKNDALNSYLMQQQYIQQLKNQQQQQQQQQQDMMMRHYLQQQQQQHQSQMFPVYSNIQQTSDNEENDDEDDEEDEGTNEEKINFIQTPQQLNKKQNTNAFLNKKQKPQKQNQALRSSMQTPNQNQTFPQRQRSYIPKPSLQNHVEPLTPANQLSNSAPANPALVPKRNGKPVNEYNLHLNAPAVSIMNSRPKTAPKTIVQTNNKSFNNKIINQPLTPTSRLPCEPNNVIPVKKAFEKNKENLQPTTFQEYRQLFLSQKKAPKAPPPSHNLENMLKPLLESSPKNPQNTYQQKNDFNFNGLHNKTQNIEDINKKFGTALSTNNNITNMSFYNTPVSNTPHNNIIPTTNMDKNDMSYAAAFNQQNIDNTTSNKNMENLNNKNCPTNIRSPNMQEKFGSDQAKQAILGSRPKRSILKNSVSKSDCYVGMNDQSDLWSCFLSQQQKQQQSSNGKKNQKNFKLPEQQSNLEKRQNLQQWQQHQQRFTLIDSCQVNQFADHFATEQEDNESRGKANFNRKKVSFLL